MDDSDVTLLQEEEDDEDDDDVDPVLLLVSLKITSIELVDFCSARIGRW